MPRVPKTKKVSTSRTITKTKDGKSTQAVGKTMTFDEPHAEVRVGQGVTLNLGNYQSLRLSVDISFPCATNQIEETFVQAKALVEAKLNEWIGEQAGNTREISLTGGTQPTSFDEGEVDLSDDL